MGFRMRLSKIFKIAFWWNLIIYTTLLIFIYRYNVMLGLVMTLLVIEVLFLIYLLQKAFEESEEVKWPSK